MRSGASNSFGTRRIPSSPWQRTTSNFVDYTSPPHWPTNSMQIFRSTSNPFGNSYSDSRRSNSLQIKITSRSAVPIKQLLSLWRDEQLTTKAACNLDQRTIPNAPELREIRNYQNIAEHLIPKPLSLKLPRSSRRKNRFECHPRSLPVFFGGSQISAPSTPTWRRQLTTS